MIPFFSIRYLTSLEEEEQIRKTNGWVEELSPPTSPSIQIPLSKPPVTSDITPLDSDFASNVTVNMSVEFTGNQTQISQLVEMGFDEERAEQMLVETGDDLETAISRLTNTVSPSKKIYYLICIY